jgi:hypothetical protein
MNRRRLVLAVALAAVLPVLVSGGDVPDGRIRVLGLNQSIVGGATYWTPIDVDTRAVYGSRSITPSLGLWNFNTPRGPGFAPQLGTRRVKRDDHRARYFDAGGGVRYTLASPGRAIVPYVTVRAAAYLAQLDRGDWHLQPGINGELGFVIAHRFILSGRYDQVRKVDGVNLSGASARVAMKLF